MIVPDRHGSGTNALLLTPPGRDRARRSGPARSRATPRWRARPARSVEVAELHSLGLDVDTPDDLAALRSRARAPPGRAPRTRAVLERLRPAGQPATA